MNNKNNFRPGSAPHLKKKEKIVLWPLVGLFRVHVYIVFFFWQNSTDRVLGNALACPHSIYSLTEKALTSSRHFIKIHCVSVLFLWRQYLENISPLTAVLLVVWQWRHQCLSEKFRSVQLWELKAAAQNLAEGSEKEPDCSAFSRGNHVLRYSSGFLPYRNKMKLNWNDAVKGGDDDQEGEYNQRQVSSDAHCCR